MQVTRKRSLLRVLLLSILGIALNYGGSWLAGTLGIPLYLDSIGTVLTASLGGYLPGIAVGLLTNYLKAIFDPPSIYYGTLNVLIALLTSWFASKHLTRKAWFLPVWILSLSVVGGILGSFMTWFLYGFAAESVTAGLGLLLHELGASEKVAELGADFAIDFVDKTVTVLPVFAILRILPKAYRRSFKKFGWLQAPLDTENTKNVETAPIRAVSVRIKIISLIASAALIIAFAAAAINMVLYRQATIEDHTMLGEGVAGLAASVVDGDYIGQYLVKGFKAGGYAETRQKLYAIRDSSPDIQYVYVYKIEEDGCHVVFDLDTDDVAASKPGEIIEFDPSFMPYVPTLLEGGEIDPIISNDQYGWLLTVYTPVRDSEGNTVCYAAADISMDRLGQNQFTFFIKEISLFLGIFILVLAIGVFFAEYNFIYPLNSMALAAHRFNYGSAELRKESVDRIKELKIHTGDEIENLYNSMIATTQESVDFVTDIQEKNDTINRMQNGLIYVLADLVEQRDQCTGDHVRKTAAYARIILEELRREGKFASQINDEYIYNVVNSAPLHDVGKIKVPDAILNKPGRLDDDEYAKMKEHTSAGSGIIDQAISLVPGSDYLAEAKNLATYHHERWDGKGYPQGLKGDEIPLSARVMAVADVFDALVSKRSYKDGFPFEQAMGIIRESSGTHFDPEVAQAFINAEEEVRKVSDDFKAQGIA